MLVLDIFFEALNYETIEQKKAYEVAGLLGTFATSLPNNNQNVTRLFFNISLLVFILHFFLASVFCIAGILYAYSGGLFLNISFCHR